MNQAKSNTEPPVLRARGLCKSYRGKVVLDGLDLDLVAGEHVVVHGAPDSGKTVLLDLITGVVRPDGGELAVLGLDPIRRSREVLRQVGCVPARPDAWDWMRPRHLFAFLGPHYPAWDEDLAEDLGAEWDVPDTRLDAMPLEMGGRVMWCAALAFRPRLLLLDDPSDDAVFRRGLEVMAEHQGSVLTMTARAVPEAVHPDRTLWLNHGRLGDDPGGAGAG